MALLLSLPRPLGRGAEGGEGWSVVQEDNKILGNAKKLRREMTPWERKLWYLFLKNCGVKVYKQKPIGKYITDFCCPSKNLVIELDGSGHYIDEQKEQDAIRTRFLNSKGYKVVRIPNSELDCNFRGVCEYLSKYLFAGNPSQAQGASSPQGASQDK